MGLTDNQLTQGPPIDEIVSLLKKHSPESLTQLRNNFPNQIQYLDEGIIAGPDENKHIKMRVATCFSGLTTALKLCNDIQPKAVRKLKTANTLRFIASIVTTVSGAAIFTVLAAEAPKTTKYIVAILALIGTLFSLVSQFVEGVLQPSSGNAYDLYKDLIEYKLEANDLHNELKIWESLNFEEFKDEVLIGRANAVCKNILILESKFGI
ncbi:hypothetical protein LX87_05526 [Larkinella arboricola]|uniref:SMODS and SLOG-associating 2TM effector domain-containing protein n=1 Tax=Larkinella arboricola TaxID=643671 RepID=A0A327WGF7_LARAB|nr:hypothetical protein [Larkinella arboricola]RAJ90047.1 hypothetical protein LX87_05526 [Larkinella arboricola]